MRAAILATLRADATLAALLPGGIHDAATVEAISRTATPSAFDAQRELRPSALVRLSAEEPSGPFRTSSQIRLTIALVQRHGRDQIEPARRRIYQLLHRVRLAPESGGAWQILHTGDLLDLTEPGLGDAPLILCRYGVPVRAAEAVVAGNALLLEAGGYLLLESGSRLLLETP